MGDPVSIGLTLASAVASNSAAKGQARMQQAQAEQQRLVLERQKKRVEREGKRKLKTNLAAQRARMGASGIGSGTGSSSALLQGMTAEGNRQINDQKHQIELQQHGIQTSLAASQYNNLLQRKQRMQAPFRQALFSGLNQGYQVLRKGE